MRTVRLGVFCTKTVKRVVVPLVAVDCILLFVPLRVVAFFWLFGSQYSAQMLSEIRSQSLLMVHRTIVQFEWQCLQRIALCFRNILVLAHLA